MSFAAAERLARSLLFEGYVLYPYRRSSLKNQQRFAFGSLLPAAVCARGSSDASAMQTECLVAGDAPVVRVSVRFLQFVARREPDGPASIPWQEAIERSIDVDELDVAALVEAPQVIGLALEASETCEDGVVRVERVVRATVYVHAFAEAAGLFRVRVGIRNATDVPLDLDRREALCHSLVSTHTVLAARGGRFVSMLEPAAGLEPYVARCRNEGTWPVLVGEGDDVVLSSPIILYDRPAIAPESHGDLFDATEIDEILTLRILTLTEDERREVMRTDPRARAILERTEALDEQGLLSLHGVFREAARSEPRATDEVLPPLGGFAPGERVRLRPRRDGDVFDLALAGEVATIAKIEVDLEGRVHYAVTIDADPGRDLGLHGQPGHRFYFARDELERIP